MVRRDEVRGGEGHESPSPIYPHPIGYVSGDCRVVDHLPVCCESCGDAWTACLWSVPERPGVCVSAWVCDACGVLGRAEVSA